ncbi:MAG: FkbM family methyltransferase [Chthoniobacterales bacterium]
MTANPPPETISLPWLLSLLRNVEFPHKLGICERLFGSALATKGICWVKASNNIAWKLDLANPTHRWIVYGDYEGHSFLEWCRKSLKNNAVIVDSGANIGQITLYLAPRLPLGRIIAVEPGDAPRAWLQECLSQYPGWKVEVVNIALGAKTEEKFLIDAGPSHSAGSWAQVADQGENRIQMRPLQELARELQMDRIDLWKLDLEGHEIPALEGARELLEQQRIGALYIELSPETSEPITNMMRAWGYQCWDIAQGGGLVPFSGVLTQRAERNALFLPDSSQR